MLVRIKRRFRSLLGIRAPRAMPLLEGLLRVRARVIRAILLFTTLLGAGLLVAGIWPTLRSPLFPFEGIGLILLSILCFGLLRIERWGVPTAAAIYISGVSQPFVYASQAYGVTHPINALYPLGVLLCGLLVGGWFLGLWSGLYIFMLGLVAYEEWQGAELPLNVAGSDAELLGTLLFWYGLILITAWLTRLLTRHLETGILVSSGQTETWATVLNQDSPPSRLLRRVFERVALQLRAAEAQLWLLESEASVGLRLLARSGEVAEEDDKSAPLPAGDTVWSRLRETAEAFASRAGPGNRYALHVPLLREGELVGRLTLMPEENQPFSAEEIAATQALAQQITLAAYLAELNVQAQEGAILSERNRMAHEIHDTLAQGFTGILMQLEAAEDTLQAEPQAAAHHLDRARVLARQSLQEARRSVQALRPLALERADLPEALRRMTGQMGDDTSLETRVVVKGQAVDLPAGTEDNLLRITQEAVNNALKHADARQLKIILSYEPDAVQLHIRDDGRGFNREHLSAGNDGYGLTSMRERAHRVGGQLAIHSRPGQGTEVVCRVPAPS